MATNNQTLKVAMMGDGGVGKSSFTIQFTKNRFVDEYDHTIDISYRKSCFVDEEATLIDILDTCGREEYSAVRDSYIRSSEGFLLLYSISSEWSMNEVTVYRDLITRIKDTDDVPIVLVGNKCDLNDQYRLITREDGEMMAKAFRVPFFEASAKTRENVEESYFELVRQIRRMKENVEATRLPRRKVKKCHLL
eukprot:TRINITY_DN1317_c0_g1_i4.p1 TRINITY_DN1317_c0_g1~~TRINITY_DN1317_c0_g1_i4.p1  ORF type:complete len:193 (+),score=30.26 TRINITY_DN1317_c0_g1_i4:116-694(+)